MTGMIPAESNSKKYLPHTRRNELGVEFDQQVVLVIDGKRGVVSQGFLDVFIREVKIAPGKNPGSVPYRGLEFGDFGFVFLGKKDVPGVRVRCCHDVSCAVGGGHAAHLDRLLE